MSPAGAAQVTEIHGGRVAYELLGPESGRSIVLTPGGRTGKDVAGLRPLAHALADGGMRVLVWDRPNCGESDIQLWGESESHMRAEILALLLGELGLAPCIVAGGSGGARDSMLTAILHPEVVSRLMLWNIVGGVFSTMNLAAFYAMPSMNAVRLGGIEAVIALAEWQHLIAANPRNEQILRDIGAQEFWRVTLRWMDAYVPKPGQTIPGVRDALFDDIDIPTLIIRGGDEDLDHPKRTSYDVHCLIKGSQLVDPPWPEDAWERAFEAQNEGRGHMFDPWPQAAPLILDFAAQGGSA